MIASFHRIVDSFVISVHNRRYRGRPSLFRPANPAFTTDSPEGLFPAAERPPDLEVERRFGLGGMTGRRYRFRSRLSTGYQMNDTAEGTLFEPRRKPKGSVILVHGWRMDDPAYWRVVGRYFAGRGYRCLLPVLPFHGSRVPAGSLPGELTLSADLLLSILAVRQAVCEILDLAHWLREHHPGRLILAGTSLGGFISLLASCVEERFDRVVAIVAGSSLARIMFDHPIGKSVKRDLEEHGLSREGLEEAWRSIAPASYPPRVPLERIRLVPARYDRIVDTENVGDLIRAWGLEDVRWLPGGHVTSTLFFRRMFAEPL